MTKWKLTTIYLLIGIAWGSFAMYKGATLAFFTPERAHYAPIGMIVNVVGWPITVPIGVYELMMER